MKSLQDLKDELARECHGQTVAEATATGLCINCHEPAFAKCYSEDGRKEYSISGMCEKCFDDLFADEE